MAKWLKVTVREQDCDAESFREAIGCLVTMMAVTPSPVDQAEGLLVSWLLVEDRKVLATCTFLNGWTIFDAAVYSP